MPVTADALLAAGIAIEIAVLGAVATLGSRLGRTEGRLAAEQTTHAEQIKAQVSPISNGFASSVTSALARIEKAQAAQSLRLDNHIDHHNNSKATR